MYVCTAYFVRILAYFDGYCSDVATRNMLTHQSGSREQFNYQHSRNLAQLHDLHMVIIEITQY